MTSSEPARSSTTETERPPRLLLGLADGLLVAGMKGLAAGKRQAPAGHPFRVGMSTAVLGVKRAATPVVARACGTREARRGPGSGPVG